MIFTLGRSGSNYLSNLLNNHPAITNYGEILGEWTIPRKIYTRMTFGGVPDAKYLDLIYNGRFLFYAGQAYSAISRLRNGKARNIKYRGNIETIGIKEFSSNFKRLGLSSYLQNHSEISVLNLYRENILKRFVSLEKMRASGVVKQAGSSQEQMAGHSRKVRLEIPYMLRQLDIYQRELDEHQGLVRLLPRGQVLDICYERLFADQDSMSRYRDRIFGFLGVRRVETHSEHRKILPDKLENVIENYDEVAQSIHETGFARYLD